MKTNSFFINSLLTSPNTLVYGYKNPEKLNYNVSIADTHVEFEIFLPGFTKEELQFYSKNGEFFIEGKPKVNSEKSYIIKNFIPQPFKYSTIIPKDCDVDGIRFIDGVLYIKLLVLSKDSSQYKEYSIE
mgnify:CR=1 FL=1